LTALPCRLGDGLDLVPVLDDRHRRQTDGASDDAQQQRPVALDPLKGVLDCLAERLDLLVGQDDADSQCGEGDDNECDRVGAQCDVQRPLCSRSDLGCRHVDVLGDSDCSEGHRERGKRDGQDLRGRRMLGEEVGDRLHRTDHRLQGRDDRLNDGGGKVVERLPEDVQLAGQRLARRGC
jgi:hypothetical protein